MVEVKMKPEPHENNIQRAYLLGIEHGQQSSYTPPRWIIANPVLWLTAYMNGFNVGRRGRLAVRGGAR